MAEHFQHPLQQRTYRERGWPQGKLAGIGARHLQNVVQQADQGIAGLSRHIQDVALSWRQLPDAQQCQGVQQSVYRGADFVADDRDEAGFVRHGGLGDLLRVLQRQFSILAFGYVGIQRDEPAGRQGTATQLHGAAVWPGALDNAHLAARPQHGHAAGDLGLRIYRTELTELGLGAQRVRHGQADPDHGGWHAGVFGEPRIPLDQPHLCIDHRHAVGHAQQRGIQLCRAGLGKFAGCRLAGIGLFQQDPGLRLPGFPGSHGTQFAQQNGYDEQQECRDACGEYVGPATPGVMRCQRLRQIYTQHHLERPADHPAESVHPHRLAG